MAIEEIYYGGKEELTMAQYEALTTLEDNVDYNITDYPNNSITNAQMKYALTCKRLFADGEIFICSDDGDYIEGHSYRLTIINNTKNWIDVTPITEIKVDSELSETSENPVQNKVITNALNNVSVNTDNVTISKTSDNRIQAIGLTNGTDTISYDTIKTAITIVRL